ncbi:hypothetical protein HN676_03010 [Candidatus Woesearchaeota archaeon]|nr:hypothetical protein [Candidatus Woesearchaeota archaeon]
MIEIDEVGIPELVAKKLTIPEKVTKYNEKFLKSLVEKGKKSYPGANFVIRPDGLKKTITDETKEQILEEIQPGYVVQRHLQNGDVCIFNRQPSLHKMSILCHKIKVIPGKTFRINPAVCFPYNADFDGDEMNLHIPQTEESRAEAELLMSVKNVLVSPCNGLTIVGCVQDAISGNYLLTKKENFTKKEAIELLYSVDHKDFTKLPKGDEVDGKDIISALLPKGFTFYGKSRSGDVIIENGYLKEGVLDSSSLGNGAGLLLRSMLQKYGEDLVSDFIGKMFKLGLKMLLQSGLTTSVSDIDTDSKFQNKIAKYFIDADSEILKISDKLYKKDFHPTKDQMIEAETEIMKILGNAQNEAMKCVSDYFNEETGTTIMINSGARGSKTNLTALAGFVGQQNSRGGRIKVGYRKRTLSCFKKYDIGSEQGGFIKSTYKKGLKPHEFFFRAITSRDAYMDIALRTPKSGYLYRRLANALQDVRVEADSTVRDIDSKIIQFKYGEDGIDVSKSEKGSIDIKKIIREVAGN